MLTGNSSIAKEINLFIVKASLCDYPVILTGETGVGKTLIAKLIHQASIRRERPFIHQACANIPETLFESELFGHEKGAFTGAIIKKDGKVRAADGGTLFFDDITDLCLQSQAKLLYFFDNKKYYRLGSSKEISADVRILSAANKDISSEINDGKFRQDLYYRLSILGFHVPPLRERKEDIPLIIEYILRKELRQNKSKARYFNKKAINKLTNYDYPGNIRELENIIKRSLSLSNDNEISENGIAFKENILVRNDNRSIDTIISRMLNDKMSYWELVHKPFLYRELTREDVRAIIRYGLEKTNYSYKKLMNLFNMSSEQKEYKKFMKAIYTHKLTL